MKNIYMVSGVIAMLGMPGWLRPAAAVPPEVVSAQQVSHVITVADVKARGSTVSGVLINKSTQVVRDVRLLIQQPWLWKDEHHPGSVSPGIAGFYTVPAEIPPNGRVPFSYEIGPLRQRTDGHFETFVEVAGFTEVGIQTSSAGSRANTLGR